MGFHGFFHEGFTDKNYDYLVLTLVHGRIIGIRASTTDYDARKGIHFGDVEQTLKDGGWEQYDSWEEYTNMPESKNQSKYCFRRSKKT